MLDLVIIECARWHLVAVEALEVKWDGPWEATGYIGVVSPDQDLAKLPRFMTICLRR